VADCVDYGCVSSRCKLGGGSPVVMCRCIDDCGAPKCPAKDDDTSWTPGLCRDKYGFPLFIGWDRDLSSED
jgi:hypothetical protein